MQDVQHQTEIRNYAVADEDQVMRIFDLNTPAFFTESERPDFLYYLRHEIDHYFVLELEGEILGAGGINLEDNGRLGIISWGMVHPDYHGQLLGRKLLLHRIAFLKELQVETITVRTSQLTAGFFNKHGFGLVEVVPDYWADGFDLYKMEYKET